MFDQLVDAIGVMLKAIAQDQRGKLFAFAAITRGPQQTKFTIVSNGEMYMVTVVKVDQ